MELTKKTIKTSKTVVLIVSFLTMSFNCNSRQPSDWNSRTWSSAINLTGKMSKKGVTELSGLHWNPVSNRLYAVQDNGRLRILQLNKPAGTFEQIADLSSIGCPEGIMQVDYNANEFYTIDEESYEIRKYTLSADLSSVILTNKWSVLVPPSPMVNTGNDGPEGIEFVPDKYLRSAGFISSETNEKYTSTKGMGGLIFIAHQKKGYIWVFDVNPNKNDDFIFVGKYKTNRNESCDLGFDRSTGLLYILHNTGENTLEVTDLSSELVSGKRKLLTKKEYNIPNPTENINVEGFAITPKFADSTNVNVWLCRDVDHKEDFSLRHDCLRWFTHFHALGTNIKDWQK